MLRNEALFGQIEFSEPPVADTHSPDLQLHLTTGENIFLHTLIQYP